MRKAIKVVALDFQKKRRNAAKHHQDSALQIIALDRHSVERGIRCPKPYLVISIRDPGTKKPRIRNTAGLRGVIYLAFHDAEPLLNFELPAMIRIMNERQAAQLATFVTKHRSSVGAIVCHCEQGMSRSPAVAAAIGHCWRIPVENLIASTQPNQHVYQLVVQAMKKIENKSVE